MNKNLFVKDLSVGSKISDYFQLKSFIRGETKSGKPYLRVELSDRTGSLKGVKWEVEDEWIRGLEDGQIFKIDGYVDVYNQDKQLRVEKMVTCDKTQINYGFFLPSSRFDPDETFKKIFGILETLKNPFLIKLCESFKADPEFCKKFKMAPAAKDNHHAYCGGLAEHVLSCLGVGDLLAGHYKQIDRDILLTGIFIHDIGKVEELEYTQAFDYSPAGKYIGHIVIGYEMMTARIKAIPDFPEALALKIKHCILAHHGELEFGSPVLPKTIEATILHHIDNIDAKINMFDFATQKGYNVKDGWVFNRPLGRQISVAEVKSSQD